MAAGEDKGHRGKARGVPVQGLAQGGSQFPGAIVIEQVKELQGEPGGRFSALAGGLKEGAAFRDPRDQTTGGCRAQSLAFLFQQGLAVSGIFDELMPVIGTSGKRFPLSRRAGARGRARRRASERGPRLGAARSSH